MPVAADSPVIDRLIGQHARERLTVVKRGLQSILDLLAGRGHGGDFHLTAPTAHGFGRASTSRAKAVHVIPPKRSRAAEPKAKPKAGPSASVRRKR
jgi:hypothetical protein